MNTNKAGFERFQIFLRSCASALEGLLPHSHIIFKGTTDDTFLEYEGSTLACYIKYI